MSPRCALVRPRTEGTLWETEEPLGAEAICGFLRDHGVVCSVFDRLLGVTPAEIEAFSPDAVGFSLMTEQDAPDALRLLQRLKKPGRMFFAGGLFVTREPERCRALFPAGTRLIPGEGEGPVLSLLTGQACEAPDPDGWAFASRDDLPEYLARGGVINLRTARGCRGSCAFCTTPEDPYRRFCTRDVSLVADEMALLASQGYPPVFNFTDDEFGDKERIFALIAALKERGVRTAFSMELRPQTVCCIAPREWAELHEGGLCRVFTGLENLDPETLHTWHKPTDPAALTEAVHACRAAGIACETGYILFHEHVTPETVIMQVYALHDAGLFSPKAALSRLVLYPGSELHAAAGISGASLCPLRPDTRRLYENWQTLLEPYYRLWSDCAGRLPGAVCREFLGQDGGQRGQLETALAEINEISFGLITGKENPSDEKKEALYALCRAAVRT